MYPFAALNCNCGWFLRCKTLVLCRFQILYVLSLCQRMGFSYNMGNCYKILTIVDAFFLFFSPPPPLLNYDTADNFACDCSFYIRACLVYELFMLDLAIFALRLLRLRYPFSVAGIKLAQFPCFVKNCLSLHIKAFHFVLIAQVCAS